MGEKIVEMPSETVKQQKGFPIWAIILIIAVPFVIIAILVLIAIVAINPAQRIRDAQERQQLEQQNATSSVKFQFNR